MTPEELEVLTCETNLMKVAEALAPLEEKERKKLAKTVTAIHRALEQRGFPSDSGKKGAQFLKAIKDRTGQWPQFQAAELAMLGLCAFTQVKRIQRLVWRIDADAAPIERVLVDRRPEWLAPWIELQLNGEWPRFNWDLLRSLIRQGVYTKPASDGYVRLLVQAGAFSTQPNKKDGGRPSLTTWLLSQDADVLAEDIWRLFEVENIAFTLNYWGNTEEAADCTWSGALIRLSQDGPIDRQKLLDASLRALSTGFNNNSLTGYIRFHEELQPTGDELAARQQNYLDLLGNPASHVVGFAMKMLKQLAKARQLDGELFLQGVAPIFRLRPKSHPKAALSLMKQLVRKDPELVRWAMNPLTEALTHEAPEVQEGAIDLLEALKDRVHPDHAATVRDRLDDLAPSVRGRAESWLGSFGTAAGNGDAASAQELADPSEVLLADLEAQAAQLDPRWRSLAAVDDVLAALRDDRFPGGLAFNILEAAVLSGVQPIAPIETVDELIDAVAHALEVIDSADEIERIMDGISRLNPLRPDDFEQRTEPLLKRMSDQSRGGSGQGLLGATNALGLIRLVGTWLRPAKHSGLTRVISIVSARFPHGKADRDQRIEAVFTQRCSEITERIKAGQAAPMLAAPTHTGGWLDPRQLISRLATLHQLGIEPPLHDLVVALLRLAPDHRAEALEAATELPGASGRLVRFALGSDEGPSTADKNDFSLWLAAGRAREPRGALASLEPLGLATDIAGGTGSIGFECRAEIHSRVDRYTKQTSRIPRFLVTTTQAFRGNVCLSSRPTLTLHAHDLVERYMPEARWALRWAATLWPLNEDPFFAAGVRRIAEVLDDSASSWNPRVPYVEPLLEPDRPWSTMARVLIWLSLLSKDADVRGTALDALIDGVTDGRADAAALGETLLDILRGWEWTKLNRAAEALAEVARLTPLHAWFAAEVALVLVAAFEEPPRDAHLLLSVLNEAANELGIAVPDSVRTVLARVKGSSKTAKLAKSLLALQRTAVSPKRQDALGLAAQGRIDRAGRWADTTAAHAET